MSESDPQKTDPSARTSKPPPIKTNRLLDSILAQDGPMPAARLHIRGLAFALDFILLTAISLLIIWKFVMPINHPGTFYDFSQWMNNWIHWFQTGGSSNGTAAPQMSQELSEGLRFAQDLQLLIFWIYFAVGEVFFSGSSLGKRICRLRSISTITLGPLPWLTGIVRAGLKTLAIFLLFPISIIITLMGVFFNRRGQMLHDLLSRTAVIDEHNLKLQSK